jgi:hypothetical protein
LCPRPPRPRRPRLACPFPSFFHCGPSNIFDLPWHHNFTIYQPVQFMHAGACIGSLTMKSGPLLLCSLRPRPEGDVRVSARFSKPSQKPVYQRQTPPPRQQQTYGQIHTFQAQLHACTTRPSHANDQGKDPQCSRPMHEDTFPGSPLELVCGCSASSRVDLCLGARERIDKLLFLFLVKGWVDVGTTS